MLEQALPWLYPIEGSPEWTKIYLLAGLVYLGTWWATRIGVKALSQAHARRFCRFCQICGNITFGSVLMFWPAGIVLSHGIRIVSLDHVILLRWLFMIPAVFVVLQYLIVGIGLVVATQSLNAGIDDEMDSAWMQFQELTWRQLAAFLASWAISIFLVDLMRRS